MPGLAAFRPMLAQTLPALKDVQFEARLTVPANVESKALCILAPARRCIFTSALTVSFYKQRVERQI